MNTIFCNWRNVPLLPFHLSIFLKEIWICIRHVAQYRQYELLIIHFAYYKECIKKYLCFSRHTAPVVLMEMIYFCQYKNNILYSINEVKHFPNAKNSVYMSYFTKLLVALARNDIIVATIIYFIFWIIKVPLQKPTSNFISQIIDLFMD